VLGAEEGERGEGRLSAGPMRRVERTAGAWQCGRARLRRPGPCAESRRAGGGGGGGGRYSNDLLGRLGPAGSPLAAGDVRCGLAAPPARGVVTLHP
jgi:hypothetical protein